MRGMVAAANMGRHLAALAAVVAAAAAADTRMLIVAGLGGEPEYAAAFAAQADAAAAQADAAGADVVLLTGKDARREAIGAAIARRTAGGRVCIARPGHDRGGLERDFQRAVGR